MIPVPDNPDPGLLRRARSGERAAFAELHARYAHALRALVEARRPGDPSVDEWCARSFARIFGRLTVLHEEHWLHLAFMRQTREFLDLEGLRVEDAGEHAPAWLRAMPIEPRELLFFDARAAARSPFPGHEYFGISEQAYEARLQRAQKAQGQGNELPEAPSPDAYLAVQWTHIEESLPAEPEPTVTGRRLPRLPVALTFLLVVAIAMLGLALAFSGERKAAEAPPFTAKTLPPGDIGTPLPRVTFETGENTVLRHVAPTRFELRRGPLEVRHAGWASPKIVLRGREVSLRRGRFSLFAGSEGAWLRVEEGSAYVRWRGANGSRRERRLTGGNLGW